MDFWRHVRCGSLSLMDKFPDLLVHMIANKKIGAHILKMAGEELKYS